jgi:hypothetical protein
MAKVFTFWLALVGIALAAGSLAVFGMRAFPDPSASQPSAAQPAWTEAKWPFLLDQWGTGRAFVCLPVDCGAKIAVYIRPKIGFCNCSTGVSDAAELERVGDTELVSPQTRPLGPGHAIKVGWMEGLIQAYRVSDAPAAERVLSIAFNDECDVVVATAKLDNGDPALIEPAVIAFLNSRPMVLWAKKELGLEFVRRDW